MKLSFRGGLETPALDEDSEDWLTAERVVATRKLGKLGEQLLVQWDNEETTWESAATMAEDAPHLVAEFRAEQARAIRDQQSSKIAPSSSGHAHTAMSLRISTRKPQAESEIQRCQHQLQLDGARGYCSSGFRRTNSRWGWIFLLRLWQLRCSCSSVGS